MCLSLGAVAPQLAPLFHYHVQTYCPLFLLLLLVQSLLMVQQLNAVTSPLAPLLPCFHAKA
jgi:hypothetical protein